MNMSHSWKCAGQEPETWTPLGLSSSEVGGICFRFFICSPANRNPRDNSINFFFFQPNFVFQFVFHYVETSGKFRNVKIIFKLNYTWRVMVMVRRGWGLTSSKSEFPLLFSGIYVSQTVSQPCFAFLLALYILQVQIYWSFPAIFYRSGYSKVPYRRIKRYSKALHRRIKRYSKVCRTDI